MTANRKILNTTLVSLEGHDFKSKSEMRFYLLLKEAGLDFGYENLTIEVLPAFRPKQWYRSGKEQTALQKKLTYTADFTVRIGGTTFLIDIKGFKASQYTLRRKLLLKHITECPSPSYAFMEVGNNMKEMNAAIDYLKNYEHVSRETQERPSGSDEALS